MPGFFTARKDIHLVVDKLSPNALSALSYINRRNGVVTVEGLKSVLRQRQTSDEVEKTLSEIVGGALALLYVQLGYQPLYKGYSKHELITPGFYNGVVVLYVPPKVLEEIDHKLNVAQQQQILSVKPYEGEPPKTVVSSSFEAFIADLLALTRYIEQNKARVLQSGELGKRDYVKLGEQLQVKESVDLNETRKLSETSRLYLLWNVAYELQLVVAKHDGTAQVSSLAARFYELARYQQLRLMIMAWITRTSTTLCVSQL